ncbi:carbon-nitrogen hydrolase [Lophiostoma macrostomum CBS 122681]|uniref:Carbon-nitrogen hydrolase n=1 Tax=Lophiostoma macrostomum CBS 122681 TaxID=1314788 RepID=A0A6A6SV93_9PLEO|nr:carbon-nitrogen hydrolase [Lophiostoma macrostomum CBS 122681]
MPQTLKIASSQSRTLSTAASTLLALEETAKHAAAQNIDILLFPEAYLGGYPRTCSFGSAVGARTTEGRDQFLEYFKAAVDLGDTPQGAGDAWIERKLPLPRDKRYRGDGTREELERIARETGVFIVTGLVERAGGTLYCGVVYVCPRLGVLGKRRKVMPTGTERLIWGQGSPSTLKAVVTHIKGVRVCMAAAICWENYMPLLRQSLYSQNVNLWLAPTADARSAWEGLMRTVGVEGRCFVLSANQCVRTENLPEWITGEKVDARERKGGDKEGLVNDTQEHHSQRPAGTRARRRSTITTTEGEHEICWPIAEEAKEGQNGDESAIVDEAQPPDPVFSDPSSSSTSKQTSAISHHPISSSSTSRDATSQADEWASRGGSCIISPLGDVLAGPLWEVEDGGLLVVEVDFEDCERGRLDLDVAGSYSRMDSFHLTVDGLDLDPPP